jgi:hypothetical protein
MTYGKVAIEVSLQERAAEHMTAPFNATLIVPLPDPATERRRPALCRVGTAFARARYAVPLERLGPAIAAAADRPLRVVPRLNDFLVAALLARYTAPSRAGIVLWPLRDDAKRY